VDQTKGDWLVQAGVNAGTRFSLEAVVQVPATEVYQFQLGGNVTGLSLCVDGVAQNWPRGRHWWFVPVHLATGWHCVRIEGTGAEAKPQLDIRFGGRGTQWLDKARFFRPTTTATRPG
jgi:hypothetical protein